MPRIRNISGGWLSSPWLPQDTEAGEIVDAPAFQPDGVSTLTWPPDKWEPVTDATASDEDGE